MISYWSSRDRVSEDLETNTAKNTIRGALVMGGWYSEIFPRGRRPGNEYRQKHRFSRQKNSYTAGNASLPRPEQYRQKWT